VVESPAASVADVTSAAVGAGTTAASKAERAATSTPPTTGAKGGDLGTSTPQATPGSQGIMEEGTRSTNDEDRCLYAGTPLEAEVVTDRRDLDTFKEAARTIGSVLLVRALVNLMMFLLRVFGCREVQLSVLFVVQSLAERAQARTGLPREAANAHVEAAAAHDRSCRLRSQPHKRSSASERSWCARHRRRRPS
jgi:hypothetical protein